jgi:hypothetical protein
VSRIGSYTEVSPSGTGAKVFFTFPAAELASLRAIMGKKPGEGSGRKWARGKGDHHVASIELYLDGRYFALTDQPLPGSPNELRPVTSEVLTWLIREAGPTFAGKGPAKRAPSSLALAALPRSVFGPQDRSHGFQSRMSAACRARRSDVQPLLMAQLQ